MVHNWHLLLDTLHGFFWALVSGLLWTTWLAMTLCGGFAYVIVLPSEGPCVGFGDADAFVLVHLHVVRGLAPFWPPFRDRCGDPARTATEFSGEVPYNYHVAAW